MGTNACENAPSAKSRRSRLGRRKATTNASIANPAPKVTARSASRANPVMRDTSVIALTEAAALRRFMGDGGASGAAGGRETRGGT